MRLSQPIWTRVLGLALAALATAYVTQISAQELAAEKIRTVAYTQKGNAPTGPSEVVIERDQGLTTHTIYRPANLTTKHPLMV